MRFARLMIHAFTLLVRERLIDFDIVPLAPYPGFARLFAETA